MLHIKTMGNLSNFLTQFGLRSNSDKFFIHIANLKQAHQVCMVKQPFGTFSNEARNNTIDTARSLDMKGLEAAVVNVISLTFLGRIKINDQTIKYKIMKKSLRHFWFC